jgi:hypothetical protein
MNSQTIRFLCLTVITLPVVAMGASTASRAQPTSFDGAYKGTLECKRGDVEVFRSLLTINIRGGRITGGARALGIDGKEEDPPIMGAGTVDPEGAFRFGYIQYERDHSLRADYNGTLNDTGGTLTLTQVFTREIAGDGRTHTCKGTFLKVELPRR